MFDIDFHTFMRYALVVSLAFMMVCMIGSMVMINNDRVFYILGKWFFLYLVCFLICFAYVCINPSPEVKELIDYANQARERVKNAYPDSKQVQDRR